MKLLLDHNLSPRLVALLGDVFADSSHVSLHGLETADDAAVWAFAQANGYAIVTKDSDFPDLSVRLGFPPKIVWLRLGNCTTRDVEAALRLNHSTLEEFDQDTTVGVFSILP